MDDPGLGPVATLVADRRGSRRDTFIVGLSGGVASGKSSIAVDLAAKLIADHGYSAQVVSTDGFLFPNERLAAMGILTRKGFPESYDVDAVLRFLDALRAGSTITIPVHDHHTYDIVEGALTVAPTDVLVLEGVNALRFRDELDLSVFLDAPEPLLREWFIARTFRLREEARSQHSPFFDPWIEASDEDFLSMAISAWELVNLPNLVEYIEPLRPTADVVIVKARDHTIVSVEVRADEEDDGRR
ncbi:MAG: type I pantothenate kinase [Acidimicrobiia bacterium]|nr:type I pantothenate kinase [Acidimicrobiia bacterium]